MGQLYGYCNLSMLTMPCPSRSQILHLHIFVFVRNLVPNEHDMVAMSGQLLDISGYRAVDTAPYWLIENLEMVM